MYYLFPFSKIKQDSSIVLYGMGTNGREFLRQIRATQYCNVKYAVDADWRQFHCADIEVYPPEKLREESEAIVVITLAARGTCQKIMQLCLGFGVPGTRIVCENCCLLESGKQQKLEAIRRLLHIRSVVGKELVRVGGTNDGGYIMLDDFVAGGIAYSFGISNDVTWDDAMANKGYEIFMYDHTIECLSKQRNAFHYFRTGISAEKNEKGLLDTLENMIHSNGHSQTRNMILKMDVEGAEWPVLETVNLETLSQFDQIVFEMHGFIDTDDLFRDSMINVLKKINVTHQVVHVHPNNYCIPVWDNDRPWPYAFEVTYVSRAKHDFMEPEKLHLPIAIDAPCNPNANELCLGLWNRD